MKWEKNHTYVKDMVEVKNSSRDFFQDTLKWLDSINAEIIELNHDLITAKHITKNQTFDFNPDYYWQKNIQILFTDDEEINSITIEISPASDYKDYIVDPYVHWRELVLDYYDSMGIQIDGDHKSILFDIDYLRILASQRATERRYVSMVMVSVFSFSLLLLVMGRLNWFLVTLITFLLIVGVYLGFHFHYLEAIHYLNKIEDQIN